MSPDSRFRGAFRVDFRQFGVTAVTPAHSVYVEAFKYRSVLTGWRLALGCHREELVMAVGKSLSSPNACVALPSRRYGRFRVKMVSIHVRNLRDPGGQLLISRARWSARRTCWRIAGLTIEARSSFKRVTSPRLEVGLGSRRLAILDLSPLGHQPMQDAETGNWIVYNGEIYNFRGIRARLEGEGVRFVSRSDTEVLLKAYGRWGERCLAELRGMFAFAIWDAKQARLLLGRDPMGIKPLLLLLGGPLFPVRFGTPNLAGTGLVPRRLDRAGLINYLNFGSAWDPITLIQGISACGPALSDLGKRQRARFHVLGSGRARKAGSCPEPT